MEAGVLFTAEIKLHYLHVIRGAEARHGNNGRPNDGFGIVRTNAGLGCAGASTQARALWIIIADRCTPCILDVSTTRIQSVLLRTVCLGVQVF